MGRLPSWKHVEPGETVAAIARSLKPHIASIVGLGMTVYSTTEFGGRPDRDQLKPMQDFISDMNTLDPRGGHFDQADFQEAMLVAICACELESQLQAASITMKAAARRT